MACLYFNDVRSFFFFVGFYERMTQRATLTRGRRHPVQSSPRHDRLLLPGLRRSLLLCTLWRRRRRGNSLFRPPNGTIGSNKFFADESGAGRRGTERGRGRGRGRGGGRRWRREDGDRKAFETSSLGLTAPRASPTRTDGLCRVSISSNTAAPAPPSSTGPE